MFEKFERFETGRHKMDVSRLRKEKSQRGD